MRPQTREAKGEQSSSVQTNQRVGAFFFDQKGALKTLNKTSQLVIRYWNERKPVVHHVVDLATTEGKRERGFFSASQL